MKIGLAAWCVESILRTSLDVHKKPGTLFFFIFFNPKDTLSIELSLNVGSSDVNLNPKSGIHINKKTRKHLKFRKSYFSQGSSA